MSAVRFSLATLVGMSLMTVQPFQGQSATSKVFVEALGGAVVPTFAIFFTKTADLNTTNAWVWPISAGFRVKF